MTLDFTPGDLAADGVHAGVPDTEYHADRSALSSSAARLLLPPSCPAIFRDRMDNPRPPKREYDFGHAAHKFVLGEGEEIVPVYADDWRTRDAKEQRDKAHAEGKIPLLVREVDKAMTMANRVHAHAQANELFSAGNAEVSLTVTDHETGIRLKARPDWMNPSDDRLVIVDYKTSTTSEPTLFSRKAYDFGYHIQEAWYRAVVQLSRLDEDPRFLFVVQEKEAPYLVSVVEFDADARAEGTRAMRQALEVYQSCVESDDWPGRSPGITSISLPPWATRHAGRTAETNQELIAALEAALTEGNPE